MVVLVALNWCKKQKKGIKLIEPNENLAKEYIQTAEESLEVLKIITNKSKVWVATTKYYCEYFAVYSLLMKIGIKCEIHECTLEICKMLEKEAILPKGYAKILEDDKQLRIDNQYYLKNREVSINYDELLKFVLTIKNLNNTITLDQVNKIREILKEK